MDFINNVINWLTENWGVTLFGTASLGTVITTTVLLTKQWIANKAQGTKYESLFNKAQEQVQQITVLYQAEKAKNNEAALQTAFLQQSQAVVMDTLIKMALASKLDSDDKASIVANVERLRLMAPAQIVEAVKENAELVAVNVSSELKENPAQTVFNIAQGAASLIEKYTKKEA